MNLNRIGQGLRLLIDTDTGSDDALALLMAGRSAAAIAAVTIVAGNVAAEQGAINARVALEAAGRSQIPVAIGARRPLVRPLVTAQEVHGQNGMGDVPLPEPHTPLLEVSGVDLLLDTVRAAPGDITLVTLGPLTNLALALEQDPEALRHLKALYIMGGGRLGNVTSAAEFNIFVDPEAAWLVFKSHLRPVLVGWDVCLGAVCDPPYLAQLRELSALGRLAVDWNRTLLAYNAQRGIQGLDLPDPLTLGAVLDPGVMTQGAAAQVDVVLAGERAGETLIDLSPRTPNATVCQQVDAGRFHRLLQRLLAVDPCPPF